MCSRPVALLKLLALAVWPKAYLVLPLTKASTLPCPCLFISGKRSSLAQFRRTRCPHPATSKPYSDVRVDDIWVCEHLAQSWQMVSAPWWGWFWVLPPLATLSMPEAPEQKPWGWVLAWTSPLSALSVPPAGLWLSLGVPSLLLLKSLSF